MKAGLLALACAFATTAVFAQQHLQPGFKEYVALRYVDAHGKTVGRALGASSPYVVMNLGRPVAVQLGLYDRNALDYTKADFQLAQLFYLSDDCSGPAYQWPGGLIGISTASVMRPKDGRLLVFVGTGGRETATARSLRNPDFECAPADFGAADLEPVLPAPIDITGRFVPPFGLR